MAVEQNTITLQDRRLLGWAEYGDPAGSPVLYFHGGLSSRLDIRFADADCRRRGVRLLAIDRPGIGLSTFQPGRSLLDWPKDVSEFLDHLGLPAAAVMGWSGGGPYVMACAYAIPDRLTAAATIAGMAPIDGHGEVAELGLGADRLLFPLSRRAPTLAAIVLGLVARRSRAATRRTFLSSLSSESDKSTVAAMSLADSTDFLFEAMRLGPAGTVHDYRIMGGAWGLDLAEVSFPVTVWQGDEDRLLPMAHAQRLSRGLQNGALKVVAGRGHFLLHHELGRVLDGLEGAAASTPTPLAS